MRRIAAVNLMIPGLEDEQYLPYTSDKSLLDADIILFCPSLPSEAKYSGREDYLGKPLLSERWSFRLKELLAHWRAELKLAVESGKLVVVYLNAPDEVYVHTGRKEYSGTGRNRQTTNIVEPLNSYSAIPYAFESVVPKRGDTIVPAGDLKHLASYWAQMSAHSSYEVHLGGKFSRPLLTTKVAERVVGAEVRSKGTLVFLPPVSFDEDAFTRYEEQPADPADPEAEPKFLDFWTDEGLAFGQRWVAAITSVDAALRNTDTEPPPAWASQDEYRLGGERELEASIATLGEKLRALTEEKASKTDELLAAGALRALLFGKGKALEQAILEALTLLGFAATPYRDAESEFDAVFESPEGRFLGEAEGKDTKAINVDKLSQLERNLHEDFARAEVTEFPKGVLFGNAFRLAPLASRADFFTAKCVSAARRGGIALVRTPDLFLAAQAVRAGASPDFRAACRKAILDATGQVVQFPQWEPPVTIVAAPTTDA